MDNAGKYDDIIQLPHHVSARHPRLGADSYAAQFSPFAALTGYGEVVEEEARSTDARGELTEEEKLRLSDKLALLLDRMGDRPEISVTYFQPDRTKSGGAYVTVTGTVRKYDDFNRILHMTDGTALPVAEIFDIRGDIFSGYEE